MIKVEKISKKFTKLIDKRKKENFYANKQISFEAKEGEVVGILGPNGAGKTTLLRIIAGIMKESEGKVEIDNLNYKNNELEIKKKIAFLTGNTKLYKDISAYELLKMTGEYYNMSNKLIEENIEKLTLKFNMKSFLHQRIESLSTGQTQRVAIARCLIHDPKYYILDEPTSGLDIISSRAILDMIKEEKKNNKCILYSTHYMEEAENICDRVILINKGKIIAEGTPKEINKMTNTNNLRDAFFAIAGDCNEEY
ncbi:MAG: ATP-binding cassette domain-containing protein [Bacilli bacterium]|nr:ATP-binding cassette domain-containing protein [Bacilli bacterium]